MLCLVPTCVGNLGDCNCNVLPVGGALRLGTVGLDSRQADRVEIRYEPEFAWLFSAKCFLGSLKADEMIAGLGCRVLLWCL